MKPWTSNKHLFPLITVLGIAGLLGGCAAVQTSSGEDYRQRIAAFGDGHVDEWAMRSADVEPLLTLPARIGVAALSGGGILQDLAEEEDFVAWRETLRFHEIGDLVAVNPLVADMMANGTSDLSPIENIRRAAARQHLDAVLILRQRIRSSRENTALAFVDLTLIGGLFLPTRSHSAQAVLDAMLIDVRNGYVYGTATGSKRLNGVSGSWGASRYTSELESRARTEAMAALNDDLADMWARLERNLPRASTKTEKRAIRTDAQAAALARPARAALVCRLANIWPICVPSGKSIS